MRLYQWGAFITNSLTPKEREEGAYSSRSMAAVLLTNNWSGWTAKSRKSKVDFMPFSFEEATLPKIYVKAYYKNKSAKLTALQVLVFSKFFSLRSLLFVELIFWVLFFQSQQLLSLIHSNWRHFLRRRLFHSLFSFCIFMLCPLWTKCVFLFKKFEVFTVFKVKKRWNSIKPIIWFTAEQTTEFMWPSQALFLGIL